MRCRQLFSGFMARPRPWQRAHPCAMLPKLMVPCIPGSWQVADNGGCKGSARPRESAGCEEHREFVRRVPADGQGCQRFWEGWSLSQVRQQRRGPNPESVSPWAGAGVLRVRTPLPSLRPVLRAFISLLGSIALLDDGFRQMFLQCCSGRS